MNYKIRYACVCDRGKVRTNNEDNFWCQGLYLDQEHQGLDKTLTGEALQETMPGFAVFDGMGGESCGEIASYLAANAFQKCYQKEIGNGSSDMEGFIRRACREMNREVYQYSLDHKIRSMGSTASVIMFGKEQIYIGNLGDTRIYHFYDDTLKQISKEHSLKRFPGDKKGPLTHYVGIPESELQVSPHIARGSYHHKDKYLICSDGLTDLVSDQEIGQVLKNGKSVKECVEILLEMALNQGGRDNITILLCELQQTGETEPAPRINRKKKWGIIGAALLLGIVALGVLAWFQFGGTAGETSGEETRQEAKPSKAPAKDREEKNVQLQEQENDTQLQENSIQMQEQEENTVGLVTKPKNQQQEPVVETAKAEYTYDEMEEDLKLLEEQYPDYMSLNSLGKTADQRDIWEAVLGDPQASRHILIQASIHAREYMNTLVAMKQIEEYLTGFESGAYENIPMENLYEDICIHVIPMVNPDGVTISQKGPAGIRDPQLRAAAEGIYQADLQNQKTTLPEEEYWRNWKANARGVDLNRNFDVGWQEYQGTSYPSSDCYKGEAPASEPETQAILQVQQENPLVCCVAYHSSGNLIYWNYGSQGQVLAQDQALAQKVQEVTEYPLHSTIDDGTDSAGCSDYFVLKLNIPAITIENGTGACPLGIEEWETLWARNKNLFPALAVLYR